VKDPACGIVSTRTNGRDRCVELVVVELAQCRLDLCSPWELDMGDDVADLLDIPWNVGGGEWRPKNEHEWPVHIRSSSAAPLVGGA
jgi:hypothetical protein